MIAPLIFRLAMWSGLLWVFALLALASSAWAWAPGLLMPLALYRLTR